MADCDRTCLQSLDAVSYTHLDVYKRQDVDFERCTFNTNTDVNIIYTKVKAKKIITTQFKFENDVLDLSLIHI